MSTQRVYEGAIVKIQGFEFIASEVEWFDDPARGRTVRFTGRCTGAAQNDGIRGTAYDGGRYGGNHLAGYIE